MKQEYYKLKKHKKLLTRELDGVFCDELVQQELDDTTA